MLRPALGNHEYLTSGAAGYFDYFSSSACATGTRGQGWYSFDVGTWHFIALELEQRLQAGVVREGLAAGDLAAQRPGGARGSRASWPTGTTR